jgi:hypothetical protein
MQADDLYSSRLPGEPPGGVEEMDPHQALPHSARVRIQFSFLSWRSGTPVEPLTEGSDGPSTTSAAILERPVSHRSTFRGRITIEEIQFRATASC